MSRVDVTLGLKNAKFQTGIEQAKGKVKELKQVTSGGLNIGKVIGGSAALATLTQIAEKYDRIGKLATRLDTSAEEIQRLGFIGEQTGSGLDVMANALTRLNRKLGDLEKNKGAADAMELLNIDIAEFKSLDLVEQLAMISDAFVEAEDRNRAFSDLFGLLEDDAKQLVPALEAGGDAIREMADSVSVLSGDNVREIELLNDTLNELQSKAAVSFGVVLAFLVKLGKHIGNNLIVPISFAIQQFQNLGRAVDILKQGDIGRAVKSFASDTKTSAQEVAKIWWDGAKEIWVGGAKETGKAVNRELSQAIAEPSQETTKAQAAVVEKMNKQAEVAKRLVELKKEYQRELEATAAAERTDAEQLLHLQERWAEEAEKFAKAKASGDQVSLGEAAIEGQKLKREISALEKELKSAAESAGEAASRALVDRLKEGLADEIEKLEAKAADFTTRKNGFAAGVDSLTAVGIGLAGVNNQQPQAFRRLEELELKTVEELKGLRSEVKALELKVNLENDEF